MTDKFIRKVIRVHCGDCEKSSTINVELMESEPSRIVHLILSVLTFGWWLIVWAIIEFTNKKKNDTAKDNCLIGKECKHCKSEDLFQMGG